MIGKESGRLNQSIGCVWCTCALCLFKKICSWAVPHGVQNPSSLTRDQTWVPPVLEVQSSQESPYPFNISSVQFSRSVMSKSLLPQGLQHTRLPCPSPTPGAYSNLCPSSRWCHPTISSSVVPFSSCLQSFPVSGSFPMSQFFASGGQRIGVSASTSVLPINIQEWFPLGWTDLILQSKGFSRVISNTTAQKHQFFSAQL